MSERYPGGFITTAPTAPTSTSAVGIWTLDQALQNTNAGTWPRPPDPYFPYVTMLLPGNGTNGAQNNTFIDGSSSGRTITRSGNTTQGAFGPFGPNWSNYFDGNGDFLELTSNSAFNMNTYCCLEAWVCLGSSGTNQLVVGRDSSYWIAFNFSTIGGAANKFVFTINNGSSWQAVSSSTTPTLGVWYHVVGIKDNTTLRIYINGAQENTATFSGTAVTSATVMGIGGNQNTELITGYISNARLVLGASSTVLPYTGNFAPPTTPLTAVSGTALLTCQSNRFIDNSGSNRSISVFGSASVQRFSPFSPTTSYSTATIGGSAYFDGSDKLTLANNAAFDCGTSNDMCWEAWVYVPSSNSGGDFHIWSAHTGGVGNGYYFTFNSSSGAQRSGLIVYSGGGSGGGMHSNINTPFNSWNHLCITRQSGRLRFFVNGQLTATTTTTYSLNTDGNLLGINGGNNFTGGVGFNGGGRYINGSVPTSYQTSSTTLNTQIFTPPTAPFTTTSQGATAGDVKVLTTFTNAGIIDNAMMNDLETVGNAQISTAQSKFGGGSLAFDGTGDWLRPPLTPQAALGSGDFTVEFWARVTDTGIAFDFCGTATWGNYIGAGKSGWSVSFASSLVSFSYQSNNSYVIATNFSGTGLSANTWYHIAIVRSSGVIKCYINGVASATTISSSADIASNTYGVWVGTAGDGDTYGYLMNGYIDDLRITKGIARYTANFTPPTAAFETY